MSSLQDTQILSPDDDGLEKAATHLREGRLVAFPTETVYGLGANALNGRAVAEIFSAKGRPSFNPLIIHVADLDQAKQFGEFSEEALKLANAFWPGPLTLVVEKRKGCGLSDLVSAGLPTIAIRIPAHPLAQSLLRRVGVPIAAPSANPSGRISPTQAFHVSDALSGKIAAVVDGGQCTVGLESTIVDCSSDPILLRPGGIALETLSRVTAINSKPEVNRERPSAPGQLESHYAPSEDVVLGVTEALPDALLLGFNAAPGSTFDLSTSGDLSEAASNLFTMLHELDGKGLPIHVSPIPNTGLGKAINDRLRRAAAPRP